MGAVISVRPEVLGGRLKVARIAKRMTQESAAAGLGLARTTIVAIEAGKRLVSPSELRAFAALYGIKESELLDSDRPDLRLQIDFRSAVQSAESDAEEVAASMLNRLATSSVQLESLLRMPSQPMDVPEVRLPSTGALEQQAEDVAMALRSRLGIGLGPIQDLIALFEMDLRVRVFERPLPSSVSGAVAYDPTAGAFVLLNSKHPLYRRRLTAAHELGHILVRRQGVSVFAEEEVDDREERFFDLFGIAFLAPAAAVRRKAEELIHLFSGFSVRHLLTMAIFFNVSIEAMARRMESLSILRRGTFERMRSAGIGLKHRERVKQDVPEAADPPAFTPRSLLLASVAHQNDLVTEQQLATMLELDLMTVRRSLEQNVGGDGESFELAV